jgi:hypothetical protein
MVGLKFAVIGQVICAVVQDGRVFTRQYADQAACNRNSSSRSFRGDTNDRHCGS